MVSQCTKFEVSKITRYDAMNVGAICRKWGSLGQLGGTQGHRQCHHSIERIRHHASILYRFRDIGGYLWKVADFDPPHLHSAPSQGVTPVEFRGDLWHQKTRVPGLSCCLCDPLFSRFSRTPTCDRHRQIRTQTDRRTQAHG